MLTLVPWGVNPDGIKASLRSWFLGIQLCTQHPRIVAEIGYGSRSTPNRERYFQDLKKGANNCAKFYSDSLLPRDAKCFATAWTSGSMVSS